MFDLTIFNWIHGLAGKSRLLDFLGMFLADYFPYAVAFIAIILLMAEKDLRKKFSYYAVLAFSVILSRGIFTEMIRFVYQRARPFIELGFTPLFFENSHSFPSGHAAFFFAVAGAVWLSDKKWGWRFFAAAALMGLARVFAGVHWPSDILAGAAVGIFSVWIADRILTAKK